LRDGSPSSVGADGAAKINAGRRGPDVVGTGRVLSQSRGASNRVDPRDEQLPSRAANAPVGQIADLPVP
jgi:hypothetical protein